MIFLNTKLSLILLAKRPVVSIIKILGLTIGVAVASLLMIYADQEFSYDKHFEKSDRIYRTLTVWKEGNSSGVNPICLRSVYDETVAKVPEAESVVQIFRGGAPDIRIGEDLYNYKRLLYADPEFVEVFTPKLLAGDIKRALSSPRMLVITNKLAETLYGEENPIGKMAVIQENTYTIEAVVEEMPYNTHFKFDMLAAMVDVDYLLDMGGLEFFTYTLFRENSNMDDGIRKCTELSLSQINTKFGQLNAEFEIEMEPLTRIHLFTKAGYDLSANGDVTIIVSLSLLAILILVLALTNYINLYLVHSENRSLEIGIRRASGSGRRRLLSLFFGESLVFTFVAYCLGLILLHSSANWIRTTFSLGLDPEIWTDPSFYLKIVGLMFLTAILAGLYPALFLSNIKPVKAIYPSSQGGSRKNRLTRIAVIFQFSITVFLITGIGFLTRQLNYVEKMPLGFESENVMIIRNMNSKLVANQDEIKSQLRSIPGVLSAGASQGTPVSGKSGQLIYKFGESENNGISIAEERVQTGYFETLGISLADGRFFRDGSPYDNSCVILNKTAVQRLGLENPVGSQVVLGNEPREVIGVVKDFHFMSLKHAIGPLVFTNYNENIYNFMVKIEPESAAQVKKSVAAIMATFDPNQAVNFRFLDDSIQANYYAERQLAKILFAGAILAILLSVMGLFAMSLFAIQDRTKEIGIRKVLGAKVSQVGLILTWSQVKWTLFAIPIGAMPAYWIMSNWMNNFMFKATLVWWMFIPAGLIAISIAILTVSIQTILVARRNPIDSLRYE